MGEACSTRGRVRNAHKIPILKPQKRPKNRWEGIKLDLKEMEKVVSVEANQGLL